MLSETHPHHISYQETHGSRLPTMAKIDSADDFIYALWPLHVPESAFNAFDTPQQLLTEIGIHSFGFIEKFSMHNENIEKVLDTVKMGKMKKRTMIPIADDEVLFPLIDVYSEKDRLFFCAQPLAEFAYSKPAIADLYIPFPYRMYVFRLSQQSHVELSPYESRAISTFNNMSRISEGDYANELNSAAVQAVYQFVRDSREKNPGEMV